MKKPAPTTEVGWSIYLSRACSIYLSAIGLPRVRLLEAVMRRFPQRDSDEVSRILATTLGQLERDGYLLRRDGAAGGAASFAFRSFLLRRYWHAREVA
jgi:hypothetical protein